MRVKRGTGRALAVGFALLACALACAPAAGARQPGEARAELDEDGRWVNGVTESWWMGEGITKEDAAGAAALWKEIGDGLGRAGAEGRAGDYFRGGETHGSYMRWSPAGFVIAHVNKCAASVTGLAYGRAEATPTVLRFLPQVDKKAAGGHDHHGGPARPAAPPRAVIRYVPVVWRGERLLVSEDEMDEFGDYVAGLGDYNGSSNHLFLDYTAYFTRSGEGVRGGGATPVVPPGYERHIKKPIVTRITSVGRRVLKGEYVIDSKYSSRTFERAALTHVTINAGSEQGVKEGMVFHVRGRGEGDTVVVLRAGRRTSAAAVVRDLDERGRETSYDGRPRGRRHSRVARGWRLTTSLFD